MKLFIKEARKFANISQAELAKKLNISATTLSGYENGLHNPTPQQLNKIAEICNTSVDFLTGRVTENVPPQLGGAVPREVIERYLGKVSASKWVPRIGSVHCGAPMLAEQDFEDTDPVPEGIYADYTLKAVGDSMKGRGILDGDIVYLRAQPVAQNGDIAALMLYEEGSDDTANVVLRVYNYEDGILTLSPANECYEDIVLEAEQINRAHVIGIVTGFFSKNIGRKARLP